MTTKRILALALLLSASAPIEALTQRLSQKYTATFYHPTGNPSACGRTKGAWGQIAVSRDLRKKYPCGTVVRVILTHPKGGIKSFKAVVWDTTHSRFKNRIDILVGRREPAMIFGKTTARLQVLK